MTHCNSVWRNCHKAQLSHGEPLPPSTAPNLKRILYPVCQHTNGNATAAITAGPAASAPAQTHQRLLPAQVAAALLLLPWALLPALPRPCLCPCHCHHRCRCCCHRHPRYPAGKQHRNSRQSWLQGVMRAWTERPCFAGTARPIPCQCQLSRLLAVWLTVTGLLAAVPLAPAAARCRSSCRGPASFRQQAWKSATREVATCRGLPSSASSWKSSSSASVSSISRSST